MRGAIRRLAWAATVLVAACAPAPEPAKPLEYLDAPAVKDVPTYRFAVHPLHNPQKLFEAYQPMIDHLNRQIPEERFELEASRDYHAFEQKFRRREPAFLLPNPWQTLEAMETGYQVLAMAGEREDFRGVFIVSKDSAIENPSDLRGKVVSYPAHTALAAAIMPQYFLHAHGIDVNRDIENRYVGSQESAIMNVYLGKSEVGVTWTVPWRAFQKTHPREAGELRQIWVTPSLPNNSVMVRNDVPLSVRDQVARALMSLDKAPGGAPILQGMETARFLPADDASYETVRHFIARFEREVRPVEQP